MFDISTLILEVKKPALYQTGASLWTHPHIAKEMLRTHLSPNTDAASYKPAMMDAICDRLPSRMGLPNGARIIDLGCGPGLYCQRLAQRGYQMTGIDQSQNSIQYAKELCASLPAEFVCGSYLDRLPCSEMDGAIMISQDYGVLSTDQRKLLLKNVHTVLKPDGVFAFDVASMSAYDAFEETSQATWSSEEKGFWRPHPFIVMQNRFFYPEASGTCDLYALLDETLTVYRIWQTYFTPESIAKELEENGFMMLEANANLSCDDWTLESMTIGVICKKVS